MLIALLLSLAHATVADDARTAADTDLPTELRETAFGRLATAEALDEVLRAIRDTATPKEQRWVLIRSLGANPSPEALDALMGLLTAKDALVRMAAIGAVGDRGDVALADKVASLLSDPAILVRSAAAESLGRLRDPGTLSDLGHALEDPTNTYRGTSLWVRRQYVDAMVAIGGDPSVPYLGRALDDQDPQVVAAAMAGLEKVAGFSYREGRSPEEELAAWKRWAQR